MGVGLFVVGGAEYMYTYAVVIRESKFHVHTSRIDEDDGNDDG